MESFDRRKLLRLAGSAALPLAAGAVLAVPALKRYARRNAAVDEMTRLAATAVDAKNEVELRDVPQAAFERIRPVFDHLCLNSRHFVDVICNSDFVTQLQAVPTPDKRRAAVVEVFSRELASTDQIMERVRGVVTGLDTFLDENWKTCCKSICDAWRTNTPNMVRRLNGENLLATTQERIRIQLEKLCASIGSDIPKYRQMIDGQSIGRSALLAMKMSWTAYGNPVFTFVCVGLTVLALKVVEWATERRAKLQELVTKEIAVAGLAIASEFRTEIRKRVEELQNWQHDAVQETIRQQAAHAIPIWG